MSYFYWAMASAFALSFAAILEVIATRNDD